MDSLLKLLKENALETPENLAKILGMTEDEVKSKIKGYENRGVIKGYRALVNEDELDINTVTSAIEVKITPEREGGFNRIATRISKFPEVQSLHLMSGGYDLLIFIRGKSLQAVAAFVSDKLATMDGVRGTGTHFVLKTYKRDGVLMNSDDEIERLKISP